MEGGPEWATASVKSRLFTKTYKLNARGRTGLVRLSRFKAQGFRARLRWREGRPPPSEMRRPTRPVIALNAALLVCATAVAVLTSPAANWDLLTFALLLGFAIASDLMGA